MSDLDPVEYEPASDPLLQTLVDLADDGRLSIPITLHVGGLVITGLLVGVGAYLDGIFGAADVRADDAALAAALPSEVQQTLKAALATATAAGEESDIPGYGYIHLKTASWYAGSTWVTFPWWRGALEAVDGWALGGMG